MKRLINHIAMTLILVGVCTLVIWVRKSLESRIGEAVDLGAVAGVQPNERTCGLAFRDKQTFFLAMQTSKSSTTVRLVDLKTMKASEQFELPSRIDGLVQSPDHLIALACETGKLQFLDAEASMKKGKAEVVFEIPTELGGLSGGAYFVHRQREYLAITDFANSSRTCLLDFQQLIKTRSFPDSQLVAYKNDGFARDVFYHDGRLFEGCGTLVGYASIRSLELDRVLQGKPVNATRIMTPLFDVDSWDFHDGLVYVTDRSSGHLFSIQLRAGKSPNATARR